jgi:hypothetical protein
MINSLCSKYLTHSAAYQSPISEQTTKMKTKNQRMKILSVNLKFPIKENRRIHPILIRWLHKIKRGCLDETWRRGVVLEEIISFHVRERSFWDAGEVEGRGDCWDKKILIWKKWTARSGIEGCCGWRCCEHDRNVHVQIIGIRSQRLLSCTDDDVAVPHSQTNTTWQWRWQWQVYKAVRWKVQKVHDLQLLDEAFQGLAMLGNVAS